MMTSQSRSSEETGGGGGLHNGMKEGEMWALALEEEDI